MDNTPEIAPMARQGDVANMNVHDTLPAADGDRTRSALIGAAAAVLAGRNRDIPLDFVAELFGHAVPEDFARYRPEELAGIAEQSWALLQERKPGAPKIRFEPAAAKPGVAVLEIINDDMPFLVDSIVGEISERGLDIRLLVHPVFTVERSETGKLNAFHGAHKGNGRRESFIHIHVDDDGDAAARADLVRTLADILAEVRVCVQDWRPMLARLSEVTAELRAAPPPLPADEIAEAIEFLQWIAADNFTLLGARDYAYTDSEQALEPRFDTGLGLLRSPEMRLLLRGDQLVTATPEIREFLNEPKLIIMTKAATALARAPPRRSRLHRRQALRPRRQACRRVAVLRAAHLDRLHALGARHSLSAAQGRQHHRARRIRSEQPFRQGAGQRPRKLSARRTVPDRRGHALSVRARDPAARRTAARARAAAL